MQGMCIVRAHNKFETDEQLKRIFAFAQAEDINVSHTVIIESDNDLKDIDFTNVDCLITVDESRISRNKETFMNFCEKLEELNITLKVLNPTIIM